MGVKEGTEGVPRALGQRQTPQPSLSPRVDLPVPTVPPVIEAGLPDLSTTEGSHALLPCTARGSPKPDITWEKDGQPVSAAEGKFTIQPSGELLVKNSEVRPRPWPRSAEGHHSDKGATTVCGMAPVCRAACRALCSLTPRILGRQVLPSRGQMMRPRL